MFCSQCGASIPDGALFCPNCGTKVETAVEPTVENAAEVVEETTETVAEVTDETVASVETETVETVTQEATQEAPKGPDPFFYGAGTNQQNQQSNPNQNANSGKGGFLGDMSHMSGMQIFGLVMAVIFAIHTITHVFGAIGNGIGSIASSIRFYTPGAYTITYLFSCLFQLVAAALAAVLCVVFFGVFRNWKPEKSAKYFTLIATASGAFVILSVISGFFSVIYYIVEDFFYSTSSISWGNGVGVPFVLVVAAIVGYIILANNAGADPFAGGYNFGVALKTVVDDFRGIVTDIQDAIAGDGGVVNATRQQSNATYNNTANNDFANNNTTYNNSTYNNTAYNNNTTYSNGGNNGMNYGALKTDRSIWAYIFLGWITCGIYQLYLIYTLERDVNIACDGDGEHTTSFWAYIGLTIVICGIYHFYWVYKLGNRLQRNAPRYGLSFQENGTSVLMWNLFGMFLCGIGMYIAMNILLENTNAICREYNAYNNL